MNLNSYLEALKDSLEAFVPDRVVSRNLKMPDQLTAAEAEAGRFTILSSELRNTRNIPGNAVAGGTWEIAVIGQIKIPEAGMSGQAVEVAELALFEDLVDWLNSPIDPSINCLEIAKFTQSQQLEVPYGWIATLIEVTL